MGKSRLKNLITTKIKPIQKKTESWLGKEEKPNYQLKEKKNFFIALFS